jgi:hypothetical protein
MDEKYIRNVILFYFYLFIFHIPGPLQNPFFSNFHGTTTTIKDELNGFWIWWSMGSKTLIM